MKKSYPWFLLIVPFFILIYSKHEMLTNPEKALFVALSSDSYREWEVEYLLGIVDVPSDDNFLTLQAIVINGHHELLDAYIRKIPKERRKAAYRVFENVALPESVDEQLRNALGIL